MKGNCSKCGTAIQDGETACPMCSRVIVDDVDSRLTQLDLDAPIPDGTVVAGEYLIVRLIGRGGGGRVYEARQISLQNMRVAIKVLHPDLNESQACLTLLKKEVIISRELTHENIIKVYSLEKSDGKHFIVMEFVPGQDLLFILRRKGNLSVQEIGPIFLGVCDALEYAHGRGVIHLDVKPANILLTTSGTVKLCDFGIARVAMGNVTTVTQRLVTGSMGYMAPEQFAGRMSVSLKCDIYSLGATVCASLTGTVPVGGIRTDGIPQSVFKAMENNPDHRFESVADFRHAFALETGIGPAGPQNVQALLSGDTIALHEGIASARLETTRTMESMDLGFPDRPIPPVDLAAFEYRSTVALDGAVPELGAGEDRTRKLRQHTLRHRVAPAPAASETSFLNEVSVRRPKRSKIWVSVALVGSLLALSIMVFGAARYHKSDILPTASRYQVAVASYDWYDHRRERDVPVKIFYPESAKGPFPAILYSSPFGSGAGADDDLGRHWAAHGYVSIHLKHRDHEGSGRRIGPPALRPIGRFLRDTENALNRPLDVRFAVDRLEAVTNEDPVFKGRLDLDRIGLAGRGTGAVTALAVAGQVFVSPLGTETTFRHPRIKAALMLNPFVPARQKAYTNKAFTRITIPCMHVIGLPHPMPLLQTELEGRHLPFAHSNGSDQYLITFSPSDSTDDSEAETGACRVPNELVRVGSTVFWDAYLKGDDKALQWLMGTGMSQSLSNYGTVQVKMAPGKWSIPVSDAQTSNVGQRKH